MTVAELIEQLQGFPSDMQVLGSCGNGETEDTFEILKIRKETHSGTYWDRSGEQEAVQIPHML